jgi:hypothetical protein
VPDRVRLGRNSAVFVRNILPRIPLTARNDLDSIQVFIVQITHTVFAHIFCIYHLGENKVLFEKVYLIGCASEVLFSPVQISIANVGRLRGGLSSIILETPYPIALNTPCCSRSLCTVFRPCSNILTRAKT